MNPRPVSVMVLAILGLIWSAFVLLAGLFGAITHFVPIGPHNPALEALKQEPQYLWTVFGLGGVNFLVMFLLVAGSIGSLSLKPWARTAMLTWAVVYLVLTVVSTVIQVTYVIPRVFDATPLPDPALRPMMHAIGLVSGCFGFVVAAALPICILIFYNRANVKAAFRSPLRPAGRMEQGWTG